MSDRRRNAEIHQLEKLLRKARRRGDAAEVVRWSRAIDLRFATRARVDRAVERRFKAERELQDFEDMRKSWSACATTSPGIPAPMHRSPMPETGCD